MEPRRARLYVDGFNLYNRRLESKPHLKWLNLVALATAVMPDLDVARVHYFTARVKRAATHTEGPTLRQNVYLRALATEPKVSVHFGQFRVDTRVMQVHPFAVDPASGEPVTTKVRKIEEKGSDVGLAARVLSDAHLGVADTYAILTNDSDQVPTIRALVEDFGVDVALVLPVERLRAAKALVKAAPGDVFTFDDEALRLAQFPEVLTDSNGEIRRPLEWSAPRTYTEGPAEAGPSNR